jgi:hypothetical protein
MAIESFDFTANSQSSGEIKSKDGELIAISVDFTTGTGTGTVDLERKIAGGAWITLEQYTADTSKNIEAVSRQCAYRCTTTAHSAGTITMYMATP